MEDIEKIFSEFYENEDTPNVVRCIKSNNGDWTSMKYIKGNWYSYREDIHHYIIEDKDGRQIRWHKNSRIYHYFEFK